MLTPTQSRTFAAASTGEHLLQGGGGMMMMSTFTPERRAFPSYRRPAPIPFFLPPDPFRQPWTTAADALFGADGGEEDREAESALDGDGGAPRGVAGPDATHVRDLLAFAFSVESAYPEAPPPPPAPPLALAPRSPPSPGRALSPPSSFSSARSARICVAGVAFGPPGARGAVSPQEQRIMRSATDLGASRSKVSWGELSAEDFAVVCAAAAYLPHFFSGQNFALRRQLVATLLEPACLVQLGRSRFGTERKIHDFRRACLACFRPLPDATGAPTPPAPFAPPSTAAAAVHGTRGAGAEHFFADYQLVIGSALGEIRDVRRRDGAPVSRRVLDALHFASSTRPAPSDAPPLTIAVPQVLAPAAAPPAAAAAHDDDRDSTASREL